MSPRVSKTGEAGRSAARGMSVRFYICSAPEGQWNRVRKRSVAPPGAVPKVLLGFVSTGYARFARSPVATFLGSSGAEDRCASSPVATFLGSSGAEDNSARSPVAPSTGTFGTKKTKTTGGLTSRRSPFFILNDQYSEKTKLRERH